MQKHHVIPISLFGYDIPENLITLLKVDHRSLHHAQDIPYDLIRKFKMSTNHLSKDSNEFRRFYAKLLIQFFAGSCVLNKVLVIQQRDSLKLQVCKLCKDKEIDEPPDIQCKSITAQLVYWAIRYTQTY